MQIVFDSPFGFPLDDYIDNTVLWFLNKGQHIERSICMNLNAKKFMDKCSFENTLLSKEVNTFLIYQNCKKEKKNSNQEKFTYSRRKHIILDGGIINQLGSRIYALSIDWIMTYYRNIYKSDINIYFDVPYSMFVTKNNSFLFNDRIYETYRKKNLELIEIIKSQGASIKIIRLKSNMSEAKINTIIQNEFIKSDILF